MKKVYLNRLQKLANHLDHGKLGHKKFNFSYYNTNIYFGEKYNTNGCGTSGCAIGECPIIFRDWKFKGTNYNPMYKDCENVEYSGEKFFGITNLEFQHIFLPNS